MHVTAHARYLRMSPRKVRLVIDVIRGMGAVQAKQQLRFMKKAAAKPVLKLLDSAVANAKNNFHLAPETLVVKSITADGGPVLKRFTPKAFGRAAPIRKRTSHVSIVLEEKGTKEAKAAKGMKVVQEKK